MQKCGHNLLVHVSILPTNHLKQSHIRKKQKQSLKKATHRVIRVAYYRPLVMAHVQACIRPCPHASCTQTTNSVV